MSEARSWIPFATDTSDLQSTAIETAADYWAEKYGNKEFYRREWQCHPYAVEMRNSLHGGQHRADWFFDHRMWVKPVKRALGIGVGLAVDELHLLARGAAEHYDLMDISAEGLAQVARTAASVNLAHRVNCKVADANTAFLGERQYGLITFMASLHHMDRMEKVLRACERALEPGGILWASEYIGPDCFQYPAEHVEHANRFYRTLDPSVRNKWCPDQVAFPTREEVLAADPTESLHSSQIEPLMRSIWPDMEFVGTYGALAFIVSWTLDHDAIYDTPVGRSEFQRLLAEDHRLTDAGELPHYYAHLIARKPL
jgi:SAM-dependent methyltransferase